MFSVIFDVLPKPDQWDAYLENAKILRPELETVDGFVDNIRYKSLTRDGWILSLSGWRDEKAVVRWRTTKRHHFVQEKGREQILSDYHLRVGQVTRDTQIPPGYSLDEQRLDETAVGEGTTVTLIAGKRPVQWAEMKNVQDCAEFLGYNPWCANCLKWDVFDAVLTPGDLILLISWRTNADAENYEAHTDLKETLSASPCSCCSRLRHVRPPGGPAILP